MLTRVRRLTTPLAVTLLAGGTALGTVAVASSAAADQGGVPAIPLNTEQETTGSNTGASGFFSYTVQGAMLCYTLTVRDLSVPVTAAHIHVGPRHVAGAIVIHLTVGSGTSFETSACTTPAAPGRAGRVRGGGFCGGGVRSVGRASPRAAGRWSRVR